MLQKRNKPHQHYTRKLDAFLEEIGMDEKEHSDDRDEDEVDDCIEEFDLEGEGEVEVDESIMTSRRQVGHSLDGTDSGRSTASGAPSRGNVSKAQKFRNRYQDGPAKAKTGIGTPATQRLQVAGDENLGADENHEMGVPEEYTDFILVLKDIGKDKISPEIIHVWSNMMDVVFDKGFGNSEEKFKAIANRIKDAL